MADTPLPTGGETREGHKKVIYFDHDGPASYTTGGEDFTIGMLKKLGLTALDFLSSCGGGDNGTHFCAVRFSVKGSQSGAVLAKILWFTSVDGAEVANAANLSTRFTRLRAVGPS